MNIYFKTIKKEETLIILPLLQKLNTTTPLDILKQRVIEMSNYNNYECVGIFDDDLLIGIGICGLWYSTRHYIGKSVEPDHIFINENYRGKKLGEQFFSWIHQYTKQKGCEAMELNTYTGNKKSHKFYYNQEFEIYNFHFLRVIREDKKIY